MTTRRSLWDVPALHLPLLKQLWRVVTMAKATDGTLERSGYIEMNTKLQQLLNPPESEQEALASAQWDWERDSEGQSSISFQVFANSIHEMLKLYSSIEFMHTEEKYAELLTLMIDRISYLRDDKAEAAGGEKAAPAEKEIPLSERTFSELQQYALAGGIPPPDVNIAEDKEELLAILEIMPLLVPAPAEAAPAEESSVEPAVLRRWFRETQDIVSLYPSRTREAIKPKKSKASRPRRKSFMERMDNDLDRREDWFATKTKDFDTKQKVAKIRTVKTRTRRRSMPIIPTEGFKLPKPSTAKSTKRPPLKSLPTSSVVNPPKDALKSNRALTSLGFTEEKPASPESQSQDVAAKFAAKWKARIFSKPTFPAKPLPLPKLVDKGNQRPQEEKFFPQDPALELANKWKRKLAQRLDKMSNLKSVGGPNDEEWAGARLTEAAPQFMSLGPADPGFGIPMGSSNPLVKRNSNLAE